MRRREIRPSLVVIVVEMDASEKSLFRLFVVVDKKCGAAEGIPDGDLKRVDCERLFKAFDGLLGSVLVEVIIAQSTHRPGARPFRQSPRFLVVRRI